MFNLQTYNMHELQRPDGEDSDSAKRAYADTGLTVTGTAEVAPAEFAAIHDGAYGKVHRFYSDDVASQLKIGMRLVRNGQSFDVRGVTRNPDAPLRRLEAVLFLATDQ